MTTTAELDTIMGMTKLKKIKTMIIKFNEVFKVFQLAYINK